MASTGSSQGLIMSDQVEINRIGADCERYWRAAGIERRAANEMRRELEVHLADAGADGRSPESVVGDDLEEFARSWAAEQQPGAERLPSWSEVFERPRQPGPLRRAILTATAVLVVAALAAAALATRGEGGDGAMDNEVWRWIWVGAAIFLGFGEMMTAGFFMLPFAVGAVVAAVLAWIDVAPWVSLIVFIGVSLVAMVALQRFVRREDEYQPQVGANRLVGKVATVLEDIDRVTGAGRVRMETELWRATTDGGPIPAGTPVRVTEVRGARLVVEPVD